MTTTAEFKTMLMLYTPVWISLEEIDDRLRGEMSRSEFSRVILEAGLSDKEKIIMASVALSGNRLPANPKQQHQSHNLFKGGCHCIVDNTKPHSLKFAQIAETFVEIDEQIKTLTDVEDKMLRGRVVAHIRGELHRLFNFVCCDGLDVREFCRPDDVPSPADLFWERREWSDC